MWTWVKNDTYEIVLCKYQERYPDASCEDVKRKLNLLRTNFRKEVKRFVSSKKYGARTYEVYVPKL
jgi:hypothetical protein